MRGAEFLAALEKLIPPTHILESQGLRREDIASIQATFRCKARKDAAPINGTELERMISEYDCSSIEVGLFCFLDQPRAHPMGVQVGSVESDPVVVRRNGDVIM